MRSNTLKVGKEAFAYAGTSCSSQPRQKIVSAGSSGKLDLVCIFVNCCGLENKTTKLSMLIGNAKPHIVMGTEFWLDSTIPFRLFCV